VNIILLGAPGSGKGTAAQDLCHQLDLRHLSTGDIFRDEIGRKTELGVKVQKLVESGKLVPDSMVLDIVTGAIAKESRGLLFDGFPRTLEQAEGLDNFFSRQSKKIDAVVLLDVPEDVIVGRLTSRRTCTKCKHVYNLVSTPPAKAGVCDKCGAELYQRADDMPETVSKRLMVYRDQTEPLVAYYKASNRLLKIDGARKPAAVVADIVAAIGRKA